MLEDEAHLFVVLLFGEDLSSVWNLANLFSDLLVAFLDLSAGLSSQLADVLLGQFELQVIILYFQVLLEFIDFWDLLLNFLGLLFELGDLCEIKFDWLMLVEHLFALFLNSLSLGLEVLLQGLDVQLNVLKLGYGESSTHLSLFGIAKTLGKLLFELGDNSGILLGKTINLFAHIFNFLLDLNIVVILKFWQIEVSNISNLNCLNIIDEQEYDC